MKRNKKKRIVHFFFHLRLWRILCLGVFFVWASTCEAHHSSVSYVLLRIHPSGINAEVQIPREDLETAIGYPLSFQRGRVEPPLYDSLAAYFLRHIHAHTSQGKEWKVNLTEMKLVAWDDSTSCELHVFLQLTPPDPIFARDITLAYDAVIDRVEKHRAMVFVLSDWENGLLESEEGAVAIWSMSPTAHTPPTLRLHLEQGSHWQGLWAMTQLGMQHIRTGADHLLFLLTLVLPAGLLVSKRRWGSYGGRGYTMRRMIKMVTSFTIGHSISLLLGTLAWVSPSSYWTEIGIAASIFVSALHAWRPLFYKREMWIGGGFGLLHGLAFSEVLVHFSLSGSTLALSLLGFNLGIEWMQIFILVACMPWLLAMYQMKKNAMIRFFWAILVAIIAIVWIVERGLEFPHLLTPYIEKWWENLWYGIAVLDVVSLGFWIFGKKKLIA